jgi:fatty-acyl-CoA synthase
LTIPNLLTVIGDNSVSNATPIQALPKSIPQAVGSCADVLAIEAENTRPLDGIQNTYDLLHRGTLIDPCASALSFFLRTEDHKTPFVWSHEQWLSCITQSANLFRHAGIQRGDVVAFVLPNLPETHWTIWGAETAGIAFAINPMLEPNSMAELLNAAKPKILVTLAKTPGTDLWEKVSEALGKVSSVTKVITVSPLRYLRSPIAPLLQINAKFTRARRIHGVPVADFHQLLRKQPGDLLKFSQPKLSDVASYFCTGGTTGLPKIAVRTHQTEVANAIQVATTFGPSVRGQSVFCGLPLFHVNGQINTGLAVWSTGAHVILGTPQGYRAPGLLQNFWDIAEYHRFVFFSGVPTVYSALLQNPPSKHDLSALRYGLCGAAPMPVELFNRFQNETGIKILEGYGMTEGGSVSSVNPPGGPTKVGSIGIRLPWQDMKIVILDAEGAYARDADLDEVGTVVITGINLFKGYLNPLHNKKIWIDRPDAHGQNQRWLNTGDLGRMDGDGYFWLTGRSKELIIRGGHNIDPKSIEEPMNGHPAVAMTAAVGRPDEHAGEVPVLYVQLRGSRSDTTPDDLMTYASKVIAERAAWPKRIVIVDTLPTTAIGKIFKPALTAMELESVFKEQAAACGAKVTHCEAKQDSKSGIVLHWAADGDRGQIRERLSRFTFLNEEI